MCDRSMDGWYGGLMHGPSLLTLRHHVVVVVVVVVVSNNRIVSLHCFSSRLLAY